MSEALKDRDQSLRQILIQLDFRLASRLNGQCGHRQIFLGGGSRDEQIDKLARLPGVYVPSKYNVSYAADGTIQGVEPQRADLALPVARLNAHRTG